MVIVGVAGRSALRRRAMCSLKWRQSYCSLETQMGTWRSYGGGMLAPILAINIALLTEGAGMELPRLQTAMNRGWALRLGGRCLE